MLIACANIANLLLARAANWIGSRLRSFSNLMRVDPGFRAGPILTFRLALPPNRYATYTLVQEFYERLLPRLRELPGSAAAELTNALPLTGTTSQTRFAVEGAPAPEAGHFPVAQLRVITAGYFSAMGIPLLEGRTFSQAEMQPAGAAVCVINESMARRFYGGRAVVGRGVLLDVLSPKPQATAIVGVVGDTREMGLAQDAEPQIYFPGYSASATVVLRASKYPLSLAGEVARQVHAVDSTLPVARIETMEAVVDATLARRRFSLRLLIGFALLAVTLACTGLYGVISYSVEQRTQELGLRQALGGEPGDLMRLILLEGLSLSGIGLAGGLLAAMLAMRIVSNFLYETSATDFLTFAISGLILCAVSTVACLAPAWRATRIDPMAALRSE